jgi:hypothetical protein
VYSRKQMRRYRVVSVLRPEIARTI